MSVTWFELWFDETTNPPYVLILRGTETELKIKCDVIDPQENSKLVYEASSYEDAKMWLLEDEYQLVTGRFTTD